MASECLRLASGLASLACFFASRFHVNLSVVWFGPDNFGGSLRLSSGLASIAFFFAFMFHDSNC